LQCFIFSFELLLRNEITRGAVDTIVNENVRDMNYFNNYDKNYHK